MTKSAGRSILARAILPILLGWAAIAAFAQTGAGRPVAPKGKPTPRTEDGKVDFSGVYSPPGRAPGDPPSKSGEGYSHNIARDLGPDDDSPGHSGSCECPVDGKTPIKLPPRGLMGQRLIERFRSRRNWCFYNA